MPPLVQLILGLSPQIFGLIKDAHAASNPNDPPLTNEQVADAFEAAFTNSDAKDQAILTALNAEIAAKQNHP